jgi:hypothetical protein
MTQAMGHERQVASTVSAEVLDKQVRRRDDGRGEPDAERDH